MYLCVTWKCKYVLQRLNSANHTTKTDYNKRRIYRILLLCYTNTTSVIVVAVVVVVVVVVVVAVVANLRKVYYQKWAILFEELNNNDCSKTGISQN